MKRRTVTEVIRKRFNRIRHSVHGVVIAFCRDWRLIVHALVEHARRASENEQDIAVVVVVVWFVFRTVALGATDECDVKRKSDTKRRRKRKTPPEHGFRARSSIGIRRRRTPRSTVSGLRRRLGPPGCEIVCTVAKPTQHEFQ